MGQLRCGGVKTGQHHVWTGNGFSALIHIHTLFSLSMQLIGEWYILTLLCIKVLVPVPFCSGGTESENLVWKVPAWDWELRRGMVGDCHWPANLYQDKLATTVSDRSQSRKSVKHQLLLQLVKPLYDPSDLMASVVSSSPVDVDQSFGTLLIMCGLCTVPCHGEHCSTGAVRRRRAGEAKGLSRSGVKGTVIGLCGSPITERAKTEAGVFIRWVGLGLIKSSVPEVTLRISKTIQMKPILNTHTHPEVFTHINNVPDVSDEVLSLPLDSDLALPLVATVSW